MPFPDFTPTIPILLRRTAERFGTHTLLVADGQRLTYADADARSRALARGLLAQGVGKGSRVGILMPNGVDWPLTWFAVTQIGAIAVLLNTFHQSKELAWTVRHADLSRLLAVPRFMSHDYLARLEAIFPDLRQSDAGRPLYVRDAPFLRAIHVWGESDRRWTLPARRPGEICVRGYALMQGLHKCERESVFESDGFYRTGDAGWLDEEGWLFFTGRLGEMVKTDGSNVTPAEVEAALLAYPEVLEAYVTGIPDADRGQLVVPAVVPRAGQAVDGDALRARLRADLSAYRVPHHIWICSKNELPFTESGKLKKLELSRRMANLAG